MTVTIKDLRAFALGWIAGAFAWIVLHLALGDPHPIPMQIVAICIWCAAFSVRFFGERGA